MSIDVKLKHSATAGKVPGASDLTAGEVAINTADEVAYIKNAAGTVVALTGAGSIPSYPNVGDGDGATLDARYVKVVGDSMTGALVLSGDPVADDQASNKKYVDDVAAAAVIDGDAKYVEVAGDDMTGDLTLGTDKITLNATNGAATFAGEVVVAPDGNSGFYLGDKTALEPRPASDGLNGTRAFPSSFSVSRATAGVVFQGRTATDVPAGTNNFTSTIFGNGSSQFAGDMAIGTTGSFTPSTPAISLTAAGSASFTGSVSTGDYNSGNRGVNLGLGNDESAYVAVRHGATGVDSNTVWIARKGSTITSNILLDGSATFAGNVEVGGSTDASTPAFGGLKFFNTGTIIANRTGSLSPGSYADCFVARYNGSDVANIKSDGSAEFAGQIVSGTTTQRGSFKAYSTGNSGSRCLLIQNPNDSSLNYASINGDGSAEFAGIVQVGGDPNAGAATGVKLRPDGIVQVGATSGTNLIFAGYTTGTADYTSYILANGSASFAGELSLSTGITNQSVQFFPNGGSIWNRSVEDQSSFAKFLGNGNEKINFRCDGSAEFAGAVTAGSAVKVGENTGSGSQDKSGIAIVSHGGLNQFHKAGDTNDFLIAQEFGAGTKVQIKSDGSAEFAGDVLIGTDIVISTAGCKIQEAGGIYSVRSSGSVAPIFQGGVIGAGENFVVKADGSATFTGNVTANIVPPSDARFKENITPAKPQLADVVALGGLLKNYDWNDQAPLNEEIRSQRQLGLIAQEAAEVCPAIVKDIHRTKQGAVITPEEIIPAVVEPAYTIPAVTKEIPNPKASKQGETITIEVKPAEEVPEQVITPEQVIPATYEVLDDSYKGISTDALIMKLIGAVTELKAELDVLKGA